MASIKPEAAAELIGQNPPRNLLIRWGYADPEELLEEHDPLDVLALAGWSEPSAFTNRNHDLIRDKLGPDPDTKLEDWAPGPVGSMAPGACQPGGARHQLPGRQE